MNGISKKIIITDNINTYFDLLLIGIISEEYDNIHPVYSTNFSITIEQIRRWNAVVQYEIIQGERVQKFKEIVNDFLDIDFNDWITLDPIFIYDYIIKDIKQVIDCENCIVAKKNEVESSFLAVFRAIYSNRKFVQIKHEFDISNRFISSDIKSIFVITDNLTKSMYNQIFRQIENIEMEENSKIATKMVPFGFLNASNFSMMTFIDLKQRLSLNTSEKDLMLLPVLQNDRFISEYCNLEILNRKKSSIVNIKNKNINKLSFTAHGRSDVIYFADDSICGKSDFSIVNHECNSNEPMCMKSPYKCFRADGEKIKISNISAKHVFLNSCDSLSLFDSEYGKYFNVSYSCFEGNTESFVGTTRWKHGEVVESIIYNCCLDLGYSLGETTVLLNKMLRYPNIESDENIYVLLGDPIKTVKNETVYSKLHIKNQKEFYVDIKYMLTQVFITQEELINDYLTGELRVKIDGLIEGYCTMCVASYKGQKGILLFIMELLDKSENKTIKVNLTKDTSEYRDTIDIYNEIEKQHNPVLGLNKYYPQKVIKGMMNDLQNNIINIATLYRTAIYKPELEKKFNTEIKKFYSKIDQSDYITAKSLQEKLSNTNFRFSEHYTDRYIINFDEKSKEKCYLCGSEVTIKSQINIIKNDSYRIEYICTRCGGIEDKPDNELTVKLYLDTKSRQENYLNVTMNILNNSNRLVSGYSGIALKNTSKWEVIVEPQVEKYEIQPFESCIKTFKVYTGKLPSHSHRVQAIVVQRQKLYLATCPLVM